MMKLGASGHETGIEEVEVLAVGGRTAIPSLDQSQKSGIYPLSQEAELQAH